MFTCLYNLYNVVYYGDVKQSAMWFLVSLCHGQQRR